ncbi:MAG: hypothetical protein NTV58_01090 [Deltaproteobacteria bacterium]|nr:hypothetical protein [Deltaproteobacteria bacterium]
MQSNLTRITLLFLLIVLLIPTNAYAETKTFIKEYTYQASELDSLASSRTIALVHVKQLLLEELGTYLESNTEVKNFELTKDRISAITAGIVKTQIIDEKWDGKNYWLKAIVKADPDDVTKSIDTLRKDRKKIENLEDMARRQRNATKEIDSLRREVEKLKSDTKNRKRFEKSVTILNDDIDIKRMNTCSERMNQRTAIFAARDWKALLIKSKEDIAYCDTINKPSDIANIYDQVAIAYYEMGKYLESNNACVAGISISYKEPGLHFTKARSLLAIGLMDDAIISFKVADKLAKHGIDIANKDIEHLDKNINTQLYEAYKRYLMSKIVSYNEIIEVIDIYRNKLQF